MAPSMKITMLGGLSIEWNGVPILKHSARLNKSLELLALLLLNSDSFVSNEQLMDELWMDEKIENPAGALKNAVYTLRKLLQQADPDLQFVITENGRYLWNPKVPVELDVWVFEGDVKHLEMDTTSEEEKLSAARSALALYTGDLLPSLSGNQWVVQYNNKLRRMYLHTAEWLAHVLEKRGGRDSLKEILDVCNRAVLLEPLYEELYVYIFNAMRNLDMKQAVLSYYPVISNMFFDELGERLPQEICDVYLWASEGTTQVEENLRQIQKDLSEITKDDRPIRGAYYCEYEMFKHVYHMVARGAARAGTSVVIMLITLSARPGKVTSKQDMVDAMLQLKDIVKNTLRKGDVFSRYSRNQYILMLPVAAIVDCTIVETRLLETYGKKSIARKVAIGTKTQELDPIV